MRISVIIPVYNVVVYLEKCLDSIISQTYEDIEILLIDDGSDDGSSEKCDEYASRDTRIKVIHTEHSGLSCARNTGIIASTAPYIMFLDADDWVDDRFCAIALHAAETNDADMVLFRKVIIDEKGRRTDDKISLPVGVISETEALKYNLGYSCAVWTGLYKRELFSEICFPEGKYYEDIGTTYRLIHKAEKICYDDHILYYYRKGRKGSITTDPCTRDTDLYEMTVRRFNDLFEWGYGKLLLNEALVIRIWFGYKGLGNRNMLRVFRYMLKHPPKDIPPKRKAMLAVYRVSPVLFDLLCEITGKRRRR